MAVRVRMVVIPMPTLRFVGMILRYDGVGGGMNRNYEDILEMRYGKIQDMRYL